MWNTITEYKHNTMNQEVSPLFPVLPTRLPTAWENVDSAVGPRITGAFPMIHN